MSGIAPDVSPLAASENSMRSGPAQGMRARYFNVYRLAAYCLVFYALGHTLGAVVATPSFGLESDRVVSMMKSVHLEAQGANCTWYGFYRGFGWLVSVFFILSAVVAWDLGGRTMRERAALGPISFSMFLSHAAGSLIAWAYFFPTPRVFSAATAGLLGLGCLQDWKRSRTSISAPTAKGHQESVRIAKEISNG
jgi:hypothetical protein